MSHVSTINTKVKDLARLQKACDALNLSLKLAQHGATLTENTYSGDVKGVASVRLKRWDYPVVFDSEGAAQYDNFGGHWGDEKELDKLLQKYAEISVTANTLTATPKNKDGQALANNDGQPCPQLTVQHN